MWGSSSLIQRELLIIIILLSTLDLHLGGYVYIEILKRLPAMLGSSILLEPQWPNITHFVYTSSIVDLSVLQR